MHDCPHCGQPVPETRLLCPHCGALALPPPAAANPAWPPPSRRLRPPPSQEPLLTGRRGLDWTLGFLPQVVPTAVAFWFFNNNWLVIFAGVFFVSLGLYFVLKSRWPVLCRGILWGVLTVPVLMLIFLVGEFALGITGGIGIR